MSTDLLWCRSLQPFRARWDNRLWAAGLATVLFTIYIGQQMSDAQNGLPLGLSETGANVLMIAVNISLVLLAVVFTAWQFAEETRTADGGVHQRTVVVPVDWRPGEQEEKDARVDAERNVQGAAEATADNETSARTSTAGEQLEERKHRDDVDEAAEQQVTTEDEQPQPKIKKKVVDLSGFSSSKAQHRTLVV